MGLVLIVVEVSRTRPDTAHSLGLLRTSDRPFTETPTWQYKTLTRDMPPAGFELAIRTSERSQIHAFDGAATEMG